MQDRCRRRTRRARSRDGSRSDCAARAGNRRATAAPARRRPRPCRSPARRIWVMSGTCRTARTAIAVWRLDWKSSKARSCSQSSTIDGSRSRPPSPARSECRGSREDDRRAVDRAEHDARMVAAGIAHHRRDRIGELAGFPAELGISPARAARQLRDADAFDDLVRRAHGFVDAGGEFDGAHARARPFGPRSMTSASSAAITAGQSAAGSDSARLPPSVPRVRTAR